MNFAPATRDVTVALEVTLTPQTLGIPQLQTRQISAQLSAPAPTGGVTLTLSLDDPALAAIDPSVFIPTGQTLSGPIDLTADLTLGTTTLRAGGLGLVEDTASINVVEAPEAYIRAGSSYSQNIFVGVDLQTGRSVFLEDTPPSPVDVVVSVPTGSGVLLSASATTVGTESLTIATGMTGTNTPTFYIQGLALNQGTELRITAPGYDQWIATIQVLDSGFYISSPTIINTTSGAANTTINVRSAMLNPNQTIKAQQAVRSGASLSVDVVSSDPTVGTISTSPVVFTGGVTQLSTEFDPAAVGVTTISIAQPTGFTPVAGKTSIVANVS